MPQTEKVALIATPLSVFPFLANVMLVQGVDVFLFMIMYQDQDIIEKAIREASRPCQQYFQYLQAWMHRCMRERVPSAPSPANYIKDFSNQVREKTWKGRLLCIAQHSHRSPPHILLNQLPFSTLPMFSTRDFRNSVRTKTLMRRFPCIGKCFGCDLHHISVGRIPSTTLPSHLI